MERESVKEEDGQQGQSDAEPGAKECGQTLEAGKGEKTDSPLEPPGGHSPIDLFILAQWDPIWTSGFRTVRL